MTKFNQFLTITTAVCLFLSACAATGQDNQAKTVVVTPAIKGTSASLNVGDTLEVQIPTIPTEGFSWQPKNLDTTILRQVGSAVYAADASPNSAGGIVTLQFIAVGAGSTNLSLLYMNSPSDPARAMSSKSFGMTVEVK